MQHVINPSGRFFRLAARTRPRQGEPELGNQTRFWLFEFEPHKTAAVMMMILHSYLQPLEL